MTDDDMFFLPAEARKRLPRTRSQGREGAASQLRVQVGEAWYPITACDDDGFEVALDVAPKLRGLVEIREGPRLLRTVLIVATEATGTTMRYDFKRATAARSTPPLDYERPEAAPSGHPGAARARRDDAAARQLPGAPEQEATVRQVPGATE